jgi:Protein of unknown function (DUF3054)
MQTVRKNRSAVLLAGDLICFLVFALLGLRSHEDGITLDGVVRAATPFQAGWLIAGLVPMFHERRSSHRSTGVLRRWMPAWVIGLGLRTLLFDRSFEVSFAVVAFIANGLLLLLWRSVLARLLFRERFSDG